MLIYDVFAGQITEKMKALVEENQYGVVYVPKNMTYEFQPIDLTVNGPAKAFLKEIFAGQITEKMKALVEENQYGVVYVPKNMTDEFQPIDLTVNGPAKAFLKEIFDTPTK